MIQTFLGKPFRYTLAAFVGLFALSMIGYFANVSLFLLALLCLGTAAATFRKLEYGLAIAFLELLSNAHGYILYDTIGGVRTSARMVIFLGVFLGWGIALLLRRSVIQWNDSRSTPFIPLALAVAIGGAVGLTRRSAVEVFQDGNAYLYLLYLLPVLSVKWDEVKKRIVLQMLAAATVFTAAASLFILYAFTHLSQSFLRVMYVYLRDIRFAEMTHMGMGMYRIFEQTQVFAIVFGFLVFERLFENLTHRNRQALIALLTGAFVCFFIGMSRSFLVGMLAATCVYLVWFLGGKRMVLKQWLTGIGSVLLSAGLAWVLIYGAVLFPFPHTRAAGEYLTGVFGDRAAGTDVAVSSRWNLLPPMLAEIKTNPLLGSGFGQTVQFVTDDPRIRALYPDGLWTTSSMEWGWLELWVKMGIMAPIGFVVLFLSVIFALRRTFSTEQAWRSLWVCAFLIFLYVTHIFSPYLNHPIGIGLILVAILFLPETNETFTTLLKKVRQFRLK